MRSHRILVLAAVALTAGIIFSVAACAGAAGHHLCGRLLARYSARRVIGAGAAASCAGSVVMALAPNAWLMGIATGAFSIVETDDVLIAWFRAHQIVAALVRPDHYVLAVARRSAELIELSRRFKECLRFAA